MKIYSKIRFIFSKRYRELRTADFVLLDVPLHGNLGDQAILRAETYMLSSLFPNKRTVSISHEDCKRYLFDIKKRIPKGTPILIHGGGFLGTLWPEEEDVFLKILSLFKDEKILVFPQTAFFGEDAEREEAAFADAVKRCQDIIIFTRDDASYGRLSRVIGEKFIRMSPDVALTLDYPGRKVRNGRVLICFRNDLERTDNHSSVLKILEEEGIEFDETDTVVFETKDSYRSELDEKIKQFSEYSLVICDRLHAMIFSAITGTPCIALDNVSGKVSGVFKWIDDLPYIKMGNEKSIESALIRKMMAAGGETYDKTRISKKFDVLYLSLREIDAKRKRRNPMDKR